MIEQAALTHGALSPEQEKQEQSRTAMRQQIAGIVAAGLTASAIAIGLFGPGRDPGDKLVQATPAPKINPEHYHPVAQFEDSSRTAENVIHQSDQELAAYGHSIDITAPNRDAQQAFDSFYNSEPFFASRPPRLREVIHIQDRNTFSKEYSAHPTVYPFEVFNTAPYPVDVLFTDYALRATRYWLNEAGKKDGIVDIGGHTLAKVEARAVPHNMVMVDQVPAFATEDVGIYSTTDGVTEWYENEFTRSFIKADGTVATPFPSETIGTEICQSLVKVYDAKTMPGEELQQQAMERFAGSFNARAGKNLNLASQEAVCNMLGRAVGAAYRNGRAALDNLPVWPVRAGLTETPWLDHSLYAAEIPHFLWLAKHITREDTEIFAAQGNDSPTARFYRQNHHFIR